MMETTGRIKADGSVQYYGYEKMKTRLVAINPNFMVLHHSGDTYWDNSGANYVAAHYEVCVLKSLRPGNEEGTWEFAKASVSEGGRSISWHPTPKESVRLAMNTLNQKDRDGVPDGMRIAASIEKRMNGC